MNKTPLTINQLNKILKKYIDKGLGYKRLEVCISKTTFQSNLEDDGCTILPVMEAKIRNYPIIDGDGGIAVNQVGKEKSKTSLVLYGDSEET